MELRKIVGQKFKLLRKINRFGKSFTQKEIAKEIGIAQTTYSGYELGRNEPDLYSLLLISSFYGVSLDYIFGRYDEVN